MKKIALTGGGTAGHITPNLALVPELKNRNFEVIYIGSKTGMDKKIVEKRHIPFFGITADKLRRYLDLKNVLMPLNVIKGIHEAKKVLKQNKVDIVFSKGGFVAVPVILAASMLKIPVISHEADFTPGLANKIAIPRSKKVCCNFEETIKYLKGKGVWTGCPIRPELLTGNREKGIEILNFKNNKPIIFVTGGSLGSKYINDLIRNNIYEIVKKFNVIHSCGKGKLDSSIQVEGYQQFELLTYDLPNVLAATDYVISRAGANVLFELLALKKPNLLIPLSTKASRGDQILNANSFMKKNYSLVLLEEEQGKNPELFIKMIDELVSKRDSMIKAMNSASEINAINNICDIIDNELSEKNST